MLTEQVREALRKKFSSSDWIVMEEVGNATGALCHRHADMLLFNTYPSRRLALIGIEIKVFLSDLKKELASPQKAEEIAQYCNEWYLAVPKGLVPDDMILPLGWGLLEIDEHGRVKKKKASDWKEDVSIPKSFWASLLRHANDVIVCRKTAVYDKGYKEAQKDYIERVDELEHQLDSFRTATNPKHLAFLDKFVKQFRAVEPSGVYFSSLTDEDISFMIFALAHKSLIQNTLLDFHRSIDIYAKDLQILEDLFHNKFKIQ